MLHRTKGKETKLFSTNSIKLVGNWTSDFKQYTSFFENTMSAYNYIDTMQLGIL